MGYVYLSYNASVSEVTTSWHYTNMLNVITIVAVVATAI